MVGAMGGDNYAIAIFNVDVSIEIKLRLKEQFGITIWDREIVLEELRKTSIELREDFERLLLEAQQGTESYTMLSGSEVSNAIKEDLFPYDTPIDPGPKPNPDHIRADELLIQLSLMPCGKDHWSAYEKLMFFLSDADIKRMMEGIKQEKSPNDYLADKLDDWLVGLSR